MLESQSSLMQGQWGKILASKGRTSRQRQRLPSFMFFIRPLAEGMAWIIGGSSQRSGLKVCVPSLEIQNRSRPSNSGPLIPGTTLPCVLLQAPIHFSRLNSNVPGKDASTLRRSRKGFRNSLYKLCYVAAVTLSSLSVVQWVVVLICWVFPRSAVALLHMFSILGPLRRLLAVASPRRLQFSYQ